MLRATIQFLRHLLAPRFNGALDECLLSVNIEQNITRVGSLRDVLYPLRELVKYLHVVLGYLELQDEFVVGILSLIICWVKFEEMAICVNLGSRKILRILNLEAIENALTIYSSQFHAMSCQVGSELFQS